MRGLGDGERYLARRLLDEGMPANEWVSSGARAMMVLDPSREGAPLAEPRPEELAGPGVIAVGDARQAAWQRRAGGGAEPGGRECLEGLYRGAQDLIGGLLWG